MALWGRRDRRGDDAAGTGPAPGADGWAEVAFRRRRVRFAIDDPGDSVQKHLVRGSFYEPGLLRRHVEMVPRGTTVVDVGANVGNHCVFYALSGAGRVYPFEPNPRANLLLRRTVAANSGLDAVDLTHVDHGVGAEPAELFPHTPGRRNLGSTRLAERGEAGEAPVQVVPLDSLTLQGRVTLLKIDVEGMELAVLAGAERLVAEHRPALAIEVDDESQDAFWDWAEHCRYHVVHAVKMYRRNINYVCIPRGSGRSPAIHL
ncbi:FkbM family methyltransferase [Nocardioides nanhaiensis]|uniref:FkbM family methyltransferase n=1 Tax=Nocardioides nanhaiensis TaxID=1476871 RepID=A0ABP8X1H2_9ACTN